jgi:5'-phosphate synthase pdxT subunit
MIGVLALQGDYEKHIQILDMLKISSIEIRYPKELEKVDGLVIPGGESTTMTDLMGRAGFYEPLRLLAGNKPILGTCAGLIMMAKSVCDSRVKPLGILDVEVDRNAYGRQVHSFTDQLPVSLNGKTDFISATFIRAPKITKVESSVKILSEYDSQPVVVRQGRHLGLAFHPELDGVTLFHEFIFKKQFEKTHAA